MGRPSLALMFVLSIGLVAGYSNEEQEKDLELLMKNIKMLQSQFHNRIKLLSSSVRQLSTGGPLLCNIISTVLLFMPAK